MTTSGHAPSRERHRIDRRALTWVVLWLAACSDQADQSSGFGVSATTGASAGTMASGGSTSGGGTSGGSTAEPTGTGTSDATDTGGSTSGPATTGTTTTTGGGPMCGNGVKERAEECDLEDYGGADCTSLDFDGGTLNCINCKINTLGCFVCGDGMIHASEACDGDNFGGATCESLGFGPGALSCAADCAAVDTSGCAPAPKCGDGVKNAMEQCDGVDLGGETCASQGFDMGNLACGVTCQFNTAGCSNICKLKGEACNGPTDCCNTGCGKGGSMCTFNGVQVCCS